jgi:hypothetical protein
MKQKKTPIGLSDSDLKTFLSWWITGDYKRVREKIAGMDQPQRKELLRWITSFTAKQIGIIAQANEYVAINNKFIEFYHKNF